MTYPVLKKNKHDFGSAVLSTQFGFELWEGSNPLARGSWSGTGEARKLGLNNISNVKNMNQLEISMNLKKQAINWASEHPIDYLILILRKLAIYFLPQNYGVMPGSNFFHPMNALVYMGFAIFIIRSIFLRRDIKDTLVLISPIISSIGLSLIFFVGYRWRYYAEPFMVICTIYLFESIKRQYYLNR